MINQFDIPMDWVSLRVPMYYLATVGISMTLSSLYFFWQAKRIPGASVTFRKGKAEIVVSIGGKSTEVKVDPALFKVTRPLPKFFILKIIGPFWNKKEISIPLRGMDASYEKLKPKEILKFNSEFNRHSQKVILFLTRYMAGLSTDGFKGEFPGSAP